LLFEVIRSAPLSVSELAIRVQALENGVSIHLRELHTYGLITPNRLRQSVYYSIRTTPPEVYPKIVLPALLDCEKAGTHPSKITHQATAFTHQRRIEIVRMLSNKPQTRGALIDSSNIKSSALSRHLYKLKNRSVVAQTGTDLHLLPQKNILGAALLEAALYQPTKSHTS
jgi:DNA-binding transcriptional ArsR family regulator